MPAYFVLLYHISVSMSSLKKMRNIMSTWHKRSSTVPESTYHLGVSEQATSANVQDEQLKC